MALKVIVIGTGFGKRSVAPVFENLGCDVEVVSARDSTAIERAVTAPCDLVSIHSPPFKHLEHVSLATAHGRHVLCDKPFGRNTDEARQMYRLAEDAGVMHFLNFQLRYDSLRRTMKQLLEQGAVGDPLHFSSTMHLATGRNAPHGWLFEKDRGGGWIGAMGSHQVDNLTWLFGDIETCEGHPRIDVRRRPDRDPASDRVHEATAEDAFTAWFRMRSGVTALLDTGCATAVNMPGVATLFGTEGTLQMTYAQELTLFKPGEEPQRFAPEIRDDNLNPALVHWFGDICKAIGSDRAIAPDFSAGVRCAEILDRLRNGL